MEDLSVFNQLLQALNAVPAVAEVLNKPIKDVAPMTASEGDTTTCLVPRASWRNQTKTPKTIKTILRIITLINPVYQVLRAATL